MTSLFADSVRLSPVFGDALFNVSSVPHLWDLDQGYAYCELAGRHRVGSGQLKPLEEAES